MSNLTRRALLGSVSAGAVLYSQASWARMGHFFAGGGGTSAGQTIASITPSGTTFTSGIANGLVCTVTVAMSPSSPLFTGTLVLSGANSGGFVVATTGASNVFDLNQSSGGTASGTYSDITLTATQGGISNSPQHITPTLVGSSATQTITAVNLSNSSFTSPGTVGETVGVITVTMSPASPSFTGTLSLTGTNASDFTISGTTLEVSSSGLAAGSYSINVVATQAGATGSPFSQPETITGAAAGSSNLPTTLTVENYSATPQTATYWRFAHVFGENDLPAGQIIHIVDGGGNVIPYTAARRSTGATGSNVCIDFLVLLQRTIAGNSSETLTLSAVSGSWNTTLPGGKTAAQIVTDRVTNFGVTGWQMLNARDAFSQAVGGGTLTALSTTAYTAGPTVPTSRLPYYRVVAQGPVALDVVCFVPISGTSLDVFFYETIFLDPSTGAVVKVNPEDTVVKNGPRTVQTQRYRGQPQITLNGARVRSWGAASGDGANFTFTSSNVNTGADNITLTGNAFSPGQLVHFSTTGTLPGGLFQTTTVPAVDFSIVETAEGGSIFRYDVTVTVANNFILTGAENSVEITGMTLGGTPILNGVYPVNLSIPGSSSIFNYTTYSNSGSVGTSPTGTATVVSDYWIAQSAIATQFPPNVATCNIYWDQTTANGNRAANPGQGGPSAANTTLTSGGSGTHTIQSSTDIYPFGNHSMRRQDGWIDWISDNSGTFTGEPTYHVVHNLTYLLSTLKVYPIDPTINFTSPAAPTETYPSSWSPTTFNGMDADFDGPGSHPEYGSPWNTIVTRAERYRDDRTGYVTSARICALGEMAGWLLCTHDEANGRIYAVNGAPKGPYSGINQYTSTQFVFGKPGGYEPVDIPAPIPGPAQTPYTNMIPPFAGVSHWHTGLMGVYVYDGCQSLYDHILELTNGLMVYLTVTTPSAQDNASAVRNPTTTGGTVFWNPNPHAGNDNSRGGAWQFNQWTDAAFIADASQPEKQYFTDVVADMAAYIAYCQGAFGANYVAQGAFPCESTPTGPPGLTNVFTPGGINPDADTANTNFMRFYVGTAWTFSYLKWPTAAMKVVAQQASNYLLAVYGSGSSCSAFSNAYGVKTLDRPGWDGGTWTSPPFSTIANMGFWSQNQAGFLYSPDGHTCLILNDLRNGPDGGGTNYQIQLEAGDRVFINDGYDTYADTADSSSPRAGPIAALLPTGVTNNTWYYVQNITTIPTGTPPGIVMSTCTLSTDMAGSSPVSWTTQSSMISTLSAAITSPTQTAISLSSALNTSVFPYFDVIMIDSEYMNVANATAATSLTAEESHTNVMGDDLSDSTLPARGALGSTATTHSIGATVTALANSFIAVDVQNRTSTCPLPSALFGDGGVGDIGYSYILNAYQAAGMGVIAGTLPLGTFTNTQNALNAYNSIGDGYPLLSSLGNLYMTIDTSLF